MAIDPAGLLYVVEGARETIVTLAPDGREIQRLGGRGSSAGQFDGLADIDPTNGLVLVAADAENGRIQRFSREFLFLESLPVEPVRRSDVDARGYTSYRRQANEASRGSGRPVAVRTGHAGETFVVDADRGTVLKWDRERAFEREIGGYDTGEGKLRTPVALALDHERRSLFVLDVAQEAILVYDFGGAYERVMAVVEGAEAIALEVVGDALFVVFPENIIRYHVRGTLEAEQAVALDAPLVDAAFRAGTVYGLTRRGLYAIESAPE